MLVPTLRSARPLRVSVPMMARMNHAVATPSGPISFALTDDQKQFQVRQVNAQWAPTRLKCGIVNDTSIIAGVE